MQHLEWCTNTLPVFYLNSGRYNIKFLKSYHRNKKVIEAPVIKKANDFAYFKFRDVQLLDTLNFLGGAIILDSFLKNYKKISAMKKYFPYE